MTATPVRVVVCPRDHEVPIMGICVCGQHYSSPASERLFPLAPGERSRLFRLWLREALEQMTGDDLFALSEALELHSPESRRETLVTTLLADPTTPLGREAKQSSPLGIQNHPAEGLMPPEREALRAAIDAAQREEGK